MEKNPFVSVIVATYNRKNQLRECLDSLQRQDYPKEKYEIVVVNDGSTDGTTELLNSYKENNNTLLCFDQKNSGPASARNYALSKSRGKIICITDDDCIADKNWIKNLISMYTEEYVGGVGGKIVAYNPKTVVEKYCDVHKGQEELSTVALITANASYRADLLKKIGGFDTDLNWLEDIDLGIRVRREGYKIVYSRDAVVYHRHHKTFFSLIQRKVAEGVQFTCLSKKYIHHFSVKYHLIRWTLKAIRKIIYLPVNVLLSKEKINRILTEFFDIVVLISNVFGLIIGSFSKVEYMGSKVDEKLHFLGK